MRRPLLTLFVSLLIGSVQPAFSLGEPVDGFPKWSERVIYQWMNRARVEPQFEMNNCGANCGEKDCYSAVPPLGWNTELSKAARFHADHLARGGYFAHDSNCVLNSNIRTTYPSTCDASPGCSCAGAGFTTFDARAAIFGGSANGEIIASSTDPNSAFYQWLFEPSATTACQFTQLNGHRWLILKSGGAVGLGVGATANAVGDFGPGVTPTKLVSGAHYPRQAASVEMWANWYDSAAPTLAQVVVDGIAHTMTRRRGTNLNGAWSATVSGVGTGCHRYYFQFRDSAGQTYRYPSTGTYGIGPAASCPDWMPTRVNDFNGDGNADLVWRNYGTGANAVWHMNGASYQGSAVMPAVTDPNWRIEGTGDFSGDGLPDILWRNNSTGANAGWVMNGTTYVTSFGIPAAPVGWQIAATADFSGDGKSDIVWRNYQNGQNAFWVMGDNGAFLNAFGLPAVADTNWRIVAAGDFSGDGKSDLIWRHSLTGANAGWVVGDNGAFLGSFNVPAVADIHWQIGGAADFSGDGKLDLIWRHTITGANAAWVMDYNGAYQGSLGFPAITDRSWQSAGPK